MQIYWSELTITIAAVGTFTGNAARDKVNTDLALVVGGDAAVAAASVTYKDKDVTGDLLLIVLRKVATDLGKAYTIAFKQDAALKNRARDVFQLYDVAGDAQREQLNTARQKHHPYVIIGCGAAAIVNHTTLRQTKWGQDRVGNSRIIHVGFEDPWSHYNRHEMGQFPQLLGLPGYQARPGVLDDTTEPYTSTKFGQNTADELTRLKARYVLDQKVLEIHPYCVAVIQPRGVTVQDSLIAALVKEGLDLDALQLRLAEEHPDTFGRYRILMVDTLGQMSWGYARYVDICTGAGKARAAEERVLGTDLYEQMRTRIWQPVESWTGDLAHFTTRKILTGTEALYRETIWDGADERYCVMGGGGVGVNMVERSQDGRREKWVDWLASGTLHASFAIGRNDILLRHPHTWNDLGTVIDNPGQPMAMDDLGDGRKDQLASLDPASRKWRFGQGSEVETATIAKTRVKIVFAPATRTNKFENVPNDPELKDQTVPPQMRDYWEQNTPLLAGKFALSAMACAGEDLYEQWSATVDVYDRLIRAGGQDIRDVGQAEKLAAHVTLSPIEAGSDGRMVGLQTSDGTLRVLGAAGTGNASLATDSYGGPYRKMTDYHDTLPAQGQIGRVGFVFSALNVAMANHYFDAANKKKTNADDVAPVTDVEVNTNVNTMSRKELEDLLGDALLARKIVRVRLATQSGFLTLLELEHALEAQEIVDTASLLLTLIAYGWEKLVDPSTLTLEIINEHDLDKLIRKIQDVRLSEWIAAARVKRGSDYTTKAQLKRDINARFFADRDARDHAREGLMQEGWKLKLPLLTVHYRVADPYVF